MSKEKDIIIKIIIIACMIIFIISSYFILKEFIAYEETNNSVEELIEEVIEKSTDEDNTETLLIDWDKLKKINENIIGWIKIEDTNVNYPVLKSNEIYYLKHSYDKKYNSNGSIFTLDLKPFESQLTTIYGHNMQNGIMFSELSRYLDEEFFYTHINFEIYTPEHNYKATVFSSYSIDVNVEENNIRELDFCEEIEYYKKASEYNVGDIGNVEKVVKLCTCSYLNTTMRPTNKRYFIIAKIEIIY